MCFYEFDKIMRILIFLRKFTPDKNYGETDNGTHLGEAVKENNSENNRHK